MSIFNIPLDLITIETIQSLILNTIPEKRQLDYKRELKFSDPSQKRELHKDIASFATASGGDIIYGIEEKDSIPIDIIPIVCNKIDQFRLSIEQSIRTNLFPRINFQIKEIEHKEGYVIIIRIVKSFQGPVAVKDGDTYRFYSRNSTGKYPLDYLEIKNQFIQSSTVKEQFINFRNSRIDLYLSGNERNDPTNSFLLFYVYPVNLYSLDFSSIEKDHLILSLRPLTFGSYDNSFNMDGFKIFKKSQVGLKQTQLFRNGAVELFDETIVTKNDVGKNVMDIISLEHKLLNEYAKVLNFYKDYLITAPFIINLSLFNMNDTRLLSTNLFQFDLDYVVNRRPNLMIPEILFESEEVSNEKALKPIFDDLWRAFGVQKALTYNGDKRKIGM